MTAGKTAFGESSPAMPVLQRPEPLSMTTAGFDMMLGVGGEQEALGVRDRDWGGGGLRRRVRRAETGGGRQMDAAQ